MTSPEFRDGRAEGLAIALDAVLRSIGDLLSTATPDEVAATLDGIVGWLATNSTAGALDMLPGLMERLAAELHRGNVATFDRLIGGAS